MRWPCRGLRGEAVRDALAERLKILLTDSALAPLCVAESCTGGLIAARITSAAGSSAYFDRGFVVYSNQAKSELLGVPEDTLARFGAVSEETAHALLKGIFARTPANLGASVTGIAGPDGGTTEKPVGTVWIAWGTREKTFTELLSLHGDREGVRGAAAEAVLSRLCDAAGGR